jgi:hypothetical protein
MEKYSLNEGNESLKRILLMMNYDNKRTLEENTKVIFEQNTSAENAVDADNDIDPRLTQSVTQQTTTVPSEATPETPLSYEDTVKKLQNLLITKYKANLGKSGADGKIGKLTLDALGDAIRTKFAKQPPTPTDGENKSTTSGTKDDETITPEDKPETTITPDTIPAVNPGTVDDWK